MTLKEAKREAWKNQNPIITKVDGHDEYVWFPSHCFDSQKDVFTTVMDVTPIYWWSSKDREWKEFKNKLAQEVLQEIQ